MNNKILALVKKENESGKLTEVVNELSVFQKIVGGYITPLYLREDIVIILNEEGSLINNTPTFIIEEMNYPLYGDFVIVGVNGDEFVGLNKEQIEFLQRMNFIEEEMTTISLEVGKPNPFMKDIREGLSVLFDETGFLFNMSFNNLKEQEIKAFRKGNVKIDLVYKNGVILFLFEIDDLMDTSDIAFSINLCNENVKKVMEVEEGKGFACKLILNDAKTGIIKAMRLISLNYEMSVKLNDCIKKQLQNPINKGAYVQIVTNLQRAYTPTELLRYSIASHTTTK